MPGSQAQSPEGGSQSIFLCHWGSFLSIPLSSFPSLSKNQCKHIFIKHTKPATAIYMKYISAQANSISKIFQLQLKNECKMLIMVHEDLHELALPNFPDSHRLPLTHSAAANAFCLNTLGCFLWYFFSARKCLFLLPWFLFFLICFFSCFRSQHKIS